MADEITLVVEATAEIPLIVDSNGLSAYEVALVNGFVGTEAEWLASLVGSGLGYTAENVANKDTDSTFATNSDTRYPSQKAVKTALDLKMDASVNAGGEISGNISNLQVLNSAILAKVLTGLSISGASISATDNLLQAFGKLQNQLNGVLGGATFQSVYDASTNSAGLVDGTGTKGHYYVVSVAGVQDFGSGSIDFNVGDWAIYNGTIWQKVDNTDAVSSVNGKLGAVSLTTADISEVTNLYFTTARVLATVLTGFTSGAGTVLATDTVLQAMQKIDGNVSGKQSTLVSGTNIKTINGVSILGSGDLTIASGITIGATSITGGATGQLLFNLGGVVSSSTGLTYASGLLTVLGTTQQAMFAYNASNRLDITIASNGSATFALTGTTPKFTFSQGAIIETISAGLGKAAISTNTTFGVDSLNFANTTGSDNAAFGYHALKSNTTGINNTSVGSGALEGNSGGSYNTSIGYQAMQVTTNGDSNVTIGYFAGKENSSFGNNSTCNTSVLIGYKAKVNASGQSNQIVIGSDAIGLGSNTVVLGNTSIVNTYLRGDVAIGLNTAASARLHIIKTTEQLRVGYDASNFASFTTASNGDLTIGLTASSGTPKLKITCRLNLSGIPTSSTGLVTGDVWSNSGILTII